MKLIAILLFVVVIVSSSSVAGESSVSVGISGGFILPMYSGTFNFTNPEYDTSYFGRLRYSLDNGRGLRIGANGVLFIDKLNRFSLGAAIGYSRFNSESCIIADQYPTRLQNGDTIIEGTFLSNEYSQISITADLDVRYKLFDNNGLGVNFGASFAFITSNSYSYVYGLIFNPNSPAHWGWGWDVPDSSYMYGINGFEPRYTDETSTAIYLYKGDLPDINPLQVSLRAGIFYDFTLEGVILSPSIVYHFPLSRISSSQEWKVSQLVGAFDIRIPL